MTIEINILQAPTTYIDGQIVHFPYKKAEALFYYLVLEKNSNRDQLSALFWCNETDEKAKKNLRQTLYTLKKALPIPMIATTGKSTVSIDPNLEIKLDFEKAKLDATSVHFSGDPFSGFYVKDAEAFDEWLTTTRMNISDLIMTAIDDQMDQALDEANHGKAVQLAKMMIAIDNLDETGYRHLIEIHGSENKYYKVQKIFDQMADLLMSELGMNPSDDIQKLYESIINRKKQEVTSQVFFYGRDLEYDIFKNSLNSFDKGKKAIVYIDGQPGDGKTMMIQKCTSSLAFDYFESHCYFAEKSHSYRPWQSILKRLFSKYFKDKKLTSSQYQVMTHYFPGIVDHYPVDKSVQSPENEAVDIILLNLIDDLIGDEKIWFVFDDLQWMDQKSLDLLSTIIHYCKPNLGFILGSRLKSDQLLRDVNRQIYFAGISLDPMTEAEIKAFTKVHPANIDINDEAIHRLYIASKGNYFLVNSGILALKNSNTTTVEAAVYTNLLKQQIIDLTEVDQKILNGLCMFFSKANIYTLSKLIKVDVIDLIDRVEFLSKKNILTEKIIDSKIHLAFSHVFIRDHIYSQQSVGKKKIFHERIADLIETQLTNQPSDRSLYPNLIYHYERSMNDQKALRYKILNLDAYFNYTHELYPVLKDGILEDVHLTADGEDIMKTFNALEKELGAYMITNTNDEWVYLKILLLQMKGRYMIKEGLYSKGLKAVQTMLTLSKSMKSPDYIILGCRQMIYYGIQKKDLKIMEEYIQLGMDTALEHDYPMDYAILQRLRGVYYLMSDRYKLAEKDLTDSLKTVRSYPNRKYELHEAGALNYLGEIKRKEEAFDEAITLYKDALTIYETISSKRGLAPILTNLAQTYLLIDEKEKAFETISKAITLFNTSRTVWKKSTALSMYHMLNSQLNEIPYTSSVYNDILKTALNINNPDEVLFVKETIKYIE